MDVYGKTKSLGEVKSNNLLNLRCSIIGPEINDRLSLLEWFLSQIKGSKVNGYHHHYWNGVTTLQFAKFCEEIMLNDLFDTLRDVDNTIHLILNQTVSKFELLRIFNNVFQKDIEISGVSDIGEPINRTLKSEKYKMGSMPMEEAIIELKNYISSSETFMQN